MAFKFALTSARLRLSNGISYPVTINEAWDAEDPLVKQNPKYFGDEPVNLMRTAPNELERESLAAAGARPVEAATRARGEKRG